MLKALCLLVKRSTFVLQLQGSSSPLGWMPANLEQGTQLLKQLQWDTVIHTGMRLFCSLPCLCRSPGVEKVYHGVHLLSL